MLRGDHRQIQEAHTISEGPIAGAGLPAHLTRRGTSSHIGSFSGTASLFP
ncbi:hypothetical protein MHY1_01752 [Methylovirgula sp. HY1]|nr:hypothetical protein MHY1_01752 [Methylovirgula sp. HY1]